MSVWATKGAEQKHRYKCLGRFCDKSVKKEKNESQNEGISCGTVKLISIRSCHEIFESDELCFDKSSYSDLSMLHLFQD